MSLNVSLDVTDKGFKEMQALLNPANMRKQTEAGLRYAGNGVTRTIAKGVGSFYAIPAARIKEDIRKPFINQDGIQIRFSRVAPTLRGYSGKPLTQRSTRKGGTIATGLSYKIFKGKGSRRPSVFWFIPEGSNVASPGIPFKRNSAARGDFNALYGPSIGSIVTGKSKHGAAIVEETMRVTLEQLLKGIERERARQVRMG